VWDEQVFEVGGGDVFLGLVGGEEAELADHLVAAPQQLDPLPDPFLVECGAGGEAVEPGRPVEEGGEREVGVVLRLWMEAHLRLHLVPDLLHLHHFDR